MILLNILGNISSSRSDRVHALRTNGTRYFLLFILLALVACKNDVTRPIFKKGSDKTAAKKDSTLAGTCRVLGADDIDKAFGLSDGPPQKIDASLLKVKVPQLATVEYEQNLQTLLIYIEPMESDKGPEYFPDNATYEVTLENGTVCKSGETADWLKEVDLPSTCQGVLKVNVAGCVIKARSQDPNKNCGGKQSQIFKQVANQDSNLSELIKKIKNNEDLMAALAKRLADKARTYLASQRGAAGAPGLGLESSKTPVSSQDAMLKTLATIMDRDESTLGVVFATSNLYDAMHDAALQAQEVDLGETAPSSTDPAVQAQSDSAVQGQSDPAVQGQSDPAVQGQSDPAVQGQSDPAVQGQSDPAAQVHKEETNVTTTSTDLSLGLVDNRPRTAPSLSLADDKFCLATGADVSKATPYAYKGTTSTKKGGSNAGSLLNDVAAPVATTTSTKTDVNASVQGMDTTQGAVSMLQKVVGGALIGVGLVMGLYFAHGAYTRYQTKRDLVVANAKGKFGLSPDEDINFKDLEFSNVPGTKGNYVLKKNKRLAIDDARKAKGETEPAAKPKADADGAARPRTEAEAEATGGAQKKVAEVPDVNAKAGKLDASVKLDKPKNMFGDKILLGAKGLFTAGMIVVGGLFAAGVVPTGVNLTETPRQSFQNEIQAVQQAYDRLREETKLLEKERDDLLTAAQAIEQP
ncbi:MAG: hypothetical protein KA436_08855 [Oligoflexales bacterium]|nr:hypothetical protein [Oligoflexales bacterium]